ncbi:MAG: ATP-binding cassette domain-containing protein [bacterium]|nr:ATP-binding cassette domain-containing protein [bacterium]
MSDSVKPIITAANLIKNYGTLRAVDGISFDISRGECFGFLGPNGAGKTSTIRMIYGFSPISDGSLMVAGMDITTAARKIKKRMGVVSQENNLDTDLTPLENLLVYSRYFGIPKQAAKARAEELIDFMQLQEKVKARVDDLSGGMKRRLVLARALVNSPNILLLDEPSTGLDPQARHLIWQRLRSLKQSGVTMILNTHYMEEATQLCDRVAVMDRGKIMMTGVPRHMVEERVGREVMELRTAPEMDGAITEALAGLQIRTERFGDTLYIYLPDDRNVRTELSRRLIDMNHREMIHRQATLEDLFLQLTGRELIES